MRIFKELVGILVAVSAFIAVLILFVWLSQGPLTHLNKTTTDFGGKIGEHFHIALVSLGPTTNGKDKYSYITLAGMASDPPNLSDYSYILPDAESVVPSQGDLFMYKILKDDSNYQLIEFYYSNTISSWSTYRAFRDKIEPVSYRKDDPGLVIIMALIGIVSLIKGDALK